MTDKEQIIIDVDEYFKGVTDDYGRPITYVINHNGLREEIITLNEEFIRKTQECEELKKELQAQRDFTAHEQKLIYCVAYDETCKTGNDCKQGKCIFKDNIKLKQTLAEIKEIAENMNNECFYDDFDCKDCDMQNGCTYFNKKQILQKISEYEELKAYAQRQENQRETYYKEYLKLSQECEELKDKLNTSEKWRIKAESLNENFELKNTCYRKALEEIEKQCKCYGRSKYTKEFDREYGGELDTNILDIITKAKDGE